MTFDRFLKIFSFVFVVFVFFGAPLYFSDKLLTENFYQNGEAYLKGAGHLFQENLSLGLVVSITDQIFSTAIISFILFFSLKKTVRLKTFKILVGILIVIFIIVTVIYGQKLTNYSTDFHNFCRSLDIITTWGCRILGLGLAFWVVTIGVRQLESKNTNQ